MPKARGSGWEELPDVRGQGQRARVPGCDSTGTDQRSYPTSEVRGSSREELPHVRGQGWRPAGRSYPMPNVRAAAERSSPMSKERWLHGCRRA